MDDAVRTILHAISSVFLYISFVFFLIIVISLVIHSCFTFFPNVFILLLAYYPSALSLSLSLPHLSVNRSFSLHSHERPREPKILKNKRHPCTSYDIKLKTLNTCCLKDEADDDNPCTPCILHQIYNSSIFLALSVKRDLSVFFFVLFSSVK